MEDNNLEEAPIISEKEIMIINIKKECKRILEKYFEGREYDEDKVNLWKEYSLEEISNYLNSNYKDFGFIILLIIINTTACGSRCIPVERKNTDDYIFECLDIKGMRIQIFIQFFKIYESKVKHIENINETILLKMNDILINKLENKKYSYEIATKDIEEIVVDINKFLLKRKPLPCSYTICYLNKKPMKFKFTYKIINLKYIPIMTTYSNDSFFAQLILFIVNN